jgi:hypothetical protein
MVVIGLTALLALRAQAPKVTLTFFEEHFIVRDGAFSESAPVKLPKENPKLSTLFRRNSTFAVWDERGLTLRVGSKTKSTKLPDIATSPKAFTKEEIKQTAAEIRKGRRSKFAAGLSGALRVGSSVYFLPRWEGKDGKPWAEALVQVDLTQKFPEPKLVARPKVLSLGDSAIDDKLFILDGLITYVARKGDSWGIQQLDPKNNRSSFEQLGDRLDSYQAGASRTGLFVERTAYGTTVSGKIDLRTRTKRIFAEDRAKMRFVDGATPACVVISYGNSATVLNSESGAIYNLVPNCAMRRTGRGIVIWTPVDAPKRAWLFDPRRWEPRAWWNAELSPGQP